jgi:hypothetical protein
MLSGNKFNQCWKHNSDGGGYSFINRGTLELKRGFFDRKEMLAAYRSDRKEHFDSPFLLHFRIATQGDISEQNTHPFRVRPDLVMAHNGHIMGHRHAIKSDTHVFVLDVLRKLPDNFENHDAILELLDGYIGSDKMVFLRADGKAMIMNEGWGKWDKNGGCWFSNDSYKKRKYTTSYTTTSAGKSAANYDTRVWNGHNYEPYSSWRDDDGEIESVVIDMKDIKADWIGDGCVMCTGPLDQYDNDICKEVGATHPVCWDCIINSEQELLDNSIIMLPFTWPQDTQVKRDSENAANELLAFPKPNYKEDSSD